MSRAQKGFTSERYIQEILINVIENIAHCKKNNVPACILSIDQSKAFDSVSHAYMREVYRFFGFGNDFIRIIETLCNNRTACIAFDDGTVSQPFDLGRGEAQGNTPSAVLYNMGEQILLFKLELCPEVASVFNHYFDPQAAAGPRDCSGSSTGSCRTRSRIQERVEQGNGQFGRIC
jgi:hypothetical protein